jgi:NAD(P)-dependent dehydrogenase (short-subunit alcohol dehydrogenase family)
MVKQAAVVVGVGAEQGLGAALCKRFAKEGRHVYVAGRTIEKLRQIVDAIKQAGGSAEAIVTDATDEHQVTNLFVHAFARRSDIDAPDLIVFNAGNNMRLRFLETSAATFEEFWRIGCYAGFLVGREAAKNLLPFGRGTVIFTGASASLRGRPGFAHFSAAKAGLRMISQSMAREFGSQGIHVAHVVIDGGINGERLLTAVPDRLDQVGENGLLGIDAIADMYWSIHMQHPSAWTQEVDLRPFKEKF